jgi:hypothetical protein
MMPLCVAAKEEDSAHIATDQHGKNDAGAFAGLEEVCEDQDVKEADAWETTFGNADAECGEGAQEPLHGGQVRHGVDSINKVWKWRFAMDDRERAWMLAAWLQKASDCALCESVAE